ncbi:hypothetical protein Tco_0948024 [Tanacetum coccineum]
MTLRDPNIYVSDLIFSGGGDTDGGSDDEGSATASSVMHASADGDRGKQTHQSQMPLYPQLEGTGSSIGSTEGSAKARQDGQQDPPHPPLDRSQQCSPVIGLYVILH